MVAVLFLLGVVLLTEDPMAWVKCEIGEILTVLNSQTDEIMERFRAAYLGPRENPIRDLLEPL